MSWSYRWCIISWRGTKKVTREHFFWRRRHCKAPSREFDQHCPCTAEPDEYDCVIFPVALPEEIFCSDPISGATINPAVNPFSIGVQYIKNGLSFPFGTKAYNVGVVPGMVSCRSVELKQKIIYPSVRFRTKEKNLGQHTWGYQTSEFILPFNRWNRQQRWSK